MEGNSNGILSTEQVWKDLFGSRAEPSLLCEPFRQALGSALGGKTCSRVVLLAHGRRERESGVQGKSKSLIRRDRPVSVSSANGKKKKEKNSSRSLVP